jgi:hypothetical protein
LAKREGISINQLVSSALAEKMSALLTEEYLEARARGGSRARFLAALAQVPDVPPDPGDELPPAKKEARNPRMQPSKARRRSRKSKRPSTRLRG